MESGRNVHCEFEAEREGSREMEKCVGFVDVVGWESHVWE